MSWITSPGDLERALSRYGPLTDVWQVVEAVSATEITVALVQPGGVVPQLGPSLAAQYANALCVFTTGALSGVPAGNGNGRFGTTVASVTTSGSPAVTTVTLRDAMPATPNAGDQLVVIRNLGINSALDVTVTSGTVNADIQGDVTATIDTSGGPVAISGDVTATIDTSGGPVAISGDVTATIAAGQSIAVDSVSGTVAVDAASAGGLPVTTGSGGLSVDVANIVDIQAASGVTIPISGDVTATIDTSGGPVEVAVSGSVNVGSVGSITETVDTHSLIQNLELNTNELVLLGWGGIPVSNLAPNAGISPGTDRGNSQMTPAQFGLYDGIVVIWSSEGGYSYGNPTGPTPFITPPAVPGSYPSQFAGSQSYPISGYQNVITQFTTNPGIWAILFDSPVAMNVFGFALYNTGATTISSDTVWVYYYGIRAQTQVNNPQTAPVNAAAPPNDMQDASGSISSGGTSQQVLGSDANRRYLLIVNATSNSDTLWVNFGSAASAGSGSIPLAPGFALEYPAGQYVPSNSVNLYAATTGDAYTVKFA